MQGEWEAKWEAVNGGNARNHNSDRVPVNLMTSRCIDPKGVLRFELSVPVANFPLQRLHSRYCFACLDLSPSSLIRMHMNCLHRVSKRGYESSSGEKKFQLESCVRCECLIKFRFGEAGFSELQLFASEVIKAGLASHWSNRIQDRRPFFRIRCAAHYHHPQRAAAPPFSFSLLSARVALTVLIEFVISRGI